MKKEFKDVPNRSGITGNYNEVRLTLDVTKKEVKDIIADNCLSGGVFKNTIVPGRKTSVVIGLWHLKKPEGYPYIIKACPTSERYAGTYVNEGYMEACCYDEAMEKLKEMAKELLAISLCQESQRCLDLAETLIYDITGKKDGSNKPIITEDRKDKIIAGLLQEYMAGITCDGAEILKDIMSEEELKAYGYDISEITDP